MDIRKLLNEKHDQYNNIHFIKDDPISVPHLFTLKQDVEIAGFFAAILAWGQRKTIINKCVELISLMDHAPYDFVTNHEDADLKKMVYFKHRTFNSTDLLYFIHFLKRHYQKHESLEEAFVIGYEPGLDDIGPLLINFRNYFINDPFFPNRTGKHIATPAKNSSCKRLSMFLRWMCRKDNLGVDFGIWNTIQPSQLICPCDVHVLKVADHLGLVQRNKADWKTALELTTALREYDKQDPVKYDFALFGMGAYE